MGGPVLTPMRWWFICLRRVDPEAMRSAPPPPPRPPTRAQKHLWWLRGDYWGIRGPSEKNDLRIWLSGLCVQLRKISINIKMCIIRSFSVSCRAAWAPSFISWSEWQIQHNASLSSEHFTVGLNMWPWFRWMSTSHLYSSNLRLLRDKCMHNCTNFLPRSLSPSSALTANSAHYAAQTSQRR